MIIEHLYALVCQPVLVGALDPSADDHLHARCPQISAQLPWSIRNDVNDGSRLNAVRANIQQQYLRRCSKMRGDSFSKEWNSDFHEHVSRETLTWTASDRNGCKRYDHGPERHVSVKASRMPYAEKGHFFEISLAIQSIGQRRRRTERREGGPIVFQKMKRFNPCFISVGRKTEFLHLSPQSGATDAEGARDFRAAMITSQQRFDFFGLGIVVRN